MNAKTIRDVLRRRYSGDATAIAFEVASGTGRHANRHVDAVVMDLWPSRGLTLHAMEIKCSTSDLKREIADGSKGEEVAQHCDLFSIVTPMGLLKSEKSIQLPKAWGLIEIAKDERIVFTKQATPTKASKLDRLFMAAMLRGAGRVPKQDVDMEISKRHRELYDGFQKDVNERADSMQPDAVLWRKLQDDLTKSGVKWTWGADIAHAVAFVLKCDLTRLATGPLVLEKKLREAADVIKNAVDEMGLPQAKEKT